MQDRIERAEEQIAHLSKAIEELSDVALEQSRRIERLERQLGLMMEREAEREFDSGGSVPLADQKPPHW
jgi:SlyX protein